MTNLSYEQYCKYYSSRCNVCSGKQRVKSPEGVWTTCICEFMARMKFEYDNIHIHPDSLKYKTWDQFDGCVYNLKGEIEGKQLSSYSLERAKKGAMTYCFGTSNVDLSGKTKVTRVIDKHLYDGQNVIIIGPSQCGKSLLAALIVKELIHCCIDKGMFINFQWTSFVPLLDAARSYGRYSSGKPIDRDTIYNFEDVDFLIIDDVHLLPGDYKPPDIIMMDNLFRSRMENHRPTIFVCATSFYQKVWSSDRDALMTKFGDNFIRLMMNDSNLVLNLEIDGE